MAETQEKKNPGQVAAELADKAAAALTKKQAEEANKQQAGSDGQPQQQQPKQDSKGKKIGQAVMNMTIKNPGFWTIVGKAAAKLIAAINDPEWAGGDSKHYTYPSSIALPAPATGITPLLTVARYQVDIRNAIDLSLYEIDVKNIIKSYFISIGHTSVSNAEINSMYTLALDIMKADTKLLSDAECYLRASNSTNMPVTTKITLNDLLSSSMRIIGNGVAAPVGVQLSQANQLRQPLLLGNISNYEWLKTYVPKLLRCVSNYRIKGMIRYLYGSAFATPIESAVNGNIWITTPEDVQAVNGTKSWKDVLDADIAACDALYDTDARVFEILEFLGWFDSSNDEAHFKRDQLGLTYKINLDPNLTAALANGDILYNCHSSYTGVDKSVACGRMNPVTDTFTMYVPNGDISITYSKNDLEVELPIGLIGEYGKFTMMGGSWLGIQAVVIKDDKSIVVADGAMLARFISSGKTWSEFKAPNTPQAITITMDVLYTKQSLVTNLLRDNLGRYNWHAFLGIEDTSDYHRDYVYYTTKELLNNPDWTPTVNNVTVGAASDYLKLYADSAMPAGCDAVAVNNYSQVKTLIFNNYTLGVDYYEKAKVHLKRLAAKTKDR